MIFSCGQQDKLAETGPDAGWDSLVNEFIHDFFEHDPAAAVSAGRHAYDGLLPDFSQAGIAAQLAMFKDYRAQVQAVDTTTLTVQQQFERQYLLSEIDENIFWIETARWPYKNPAYYFGALSPSRYITFGYAPPETRLASLVKHLDNLPGAVAQMRENLQDTLPATYVQLGHAYFDGLASYFENDVPPIFSDVQNDSLQAQFKAANTRAIVAARQMAEWLTKKQTSDNYAMGLDLFQQMLLATEAVSTPVSELKARGQKDLERNLAALKAACEKLAPGKSIEACVAMVQARKPEGGPVAGAMKQMTRLKDFIVQHDIVSIPGSENCLVAEAPPYRRSNSAYIEIPGPYEEGLAATYYIAPPDAAWTRDEQLQYIPGEADLMFISVHEVWPGHFLQFLHSNRSPRLAGRLFVGYAFAEGWAHYTEEMMYNAGLEQDNPEMHIGQLLNALLRNVRYLSAIGLHTEGMTVEASEKMFREYAYQDPGNARQQAARGTYDPAYLNYTLGKLMIMDLREKWQAKTNGSLKEFHDRFLSYGGPPIGLMRKVMLND